MLRDNPLCERLHEVTRLAHRRLERRVDIYRPNFDVHHYRRLLQGFWGFYQPLERKLAVLADHNLPSSYYSQRRCKASRLKQDLLSLGVTETDIAALPLCGRLPATPTLLQVFGVLYVIDGAALSERIVTIHSGGDKLGIGPSQGGSFFSSLNTSYDPLFNTWWQDLIAITGAVNDPDFQDLVIQSALDTLDCFETWLDYRKQSPLTNSTNSMRWSSQWEFELFCTDLDKVA